MYLLLPVATHADVSASTVTLVRQEYSAFGLAGDQQPAGDSGWGGCFALRGFSDAWVRQVRSCIQEAH